MPTQNSLPSLDSTPPPAGEKKPSVPAVLHGFVRLTSGEQRREFYQKLPEKKWWQSGHTRKWNDSWASIFDNYKWKCVYCPRDLAESTDVLAESTEEHLVPRSLLEAVDGEPNNTANMAPACARCNGLKNEFVPPCDHIGWASPDAYVAACQDFILLRQKDNFDRYKDHVARVLADRAKQKSGTQQG